MMGKEASKDIGQFDLCLYLTTDQFYTGQKRLNYILNTHGNSFSIEVGLYFVLATGNVWHLIAHIT